MSFSLVTVELLDTSAAIFAAFRALAFFRPIVKVYSVPDNRKVKSKVGFDSKYCSMKDLSDTFFNDV